MDALPTEAFNMNMVGGFALVMVIQTLGIRMLLKMMGKQHSETIAILTDQLNHERAEKGELQMKKLEVLSAMHDSLTGVGDQAATNHAELKAHVTAKTDELKAHVTASVQPTPQ